MQGFPENFEFPVSKTAAMKQLGNSVAIHAVKAVGKEMIKVLKDAIQKYYNNQNQIFSLE
ncbi:hypothetical protein CJJ23_02880 [Mycoplasmopsis agassizii]|uniref:Uncharacterized protein n=1 Tax=Mycoplasmopsis agassizii TaxID=33922 RepID=A0A269TIQ2_9BACT|nr:DNA cytosine methyltransferase [Mycoplasmopsis agassizii]PAK21267.1 hypothetical protein CJJ23_02880 [Mycoplasmopsis agassizii]